jgi:hypothetical protein
MAIYVLDFKFLRRNYPAEDDDPRLFPVREGAMRHDLSLFV